VSGLADLVYEELMLLHAHIRPTFVTYKEFLEWRERDADAVDVNEAEDFARFVRGVAVEAGCANVIGAADSLLRIARVIGKRPIPVDPETGFEQATQLHSYWQAMLARREKREQERRGRPDRWAAKERVTTSDIANLLWPDERPGFAASYVFGLLKASGYVDGAARNWRLTDKGRELGEERGRFIYWKKEMLEIVRGELQRRASEPGTLDSGEAAGAASVR
jgi:hypothetical protein